MLTYISGVYFYFIFFFQGDLTDGRTEDSFGSRQFEEEWKLYRSTLDKAEIRKKTVWLDVRGNHGETCIFSILQNK